MSSLPKAFSLSTTVLLVVVAFLVGVFVHKRHQEHSNRRQHHHHHFDDEEHHRHHADRRPKRFSRSLQYRRAAAGRGEVDDDSFLGPHGLGMIINQARQKGKQFAMKWLKQPRSFTTVVGPSAIEAQQAYSTFWSDHLLGMHPPVWHTPGFTDVWIDYGHGDDVYKQAITDIDPTNTELIQKFERPSGVVLKPASATMQTYMGYLDALMDHHQRAVEAHDEAAANLYAAMTVTAISMCQGTNWAHIGQAILADKDQAVTANKRLLAIGRTMGGATGSKIRLMRPLISHYGFTFEVAAQALMYEAQLMKFTPEQLQELQQKIRVLEAKLKKKFSARAITH